MCTCTCRLVLFVINIIVGLIGFLLMLFGSLMAWGKSIVSEQIQGHLGPMAQRFSATADTEHIKDMAELVLRFTSPFGLLIFGFGTAILILCVFGCCGACSGKNYCMKIYTALLILIALAEIVLLGFYYTNRTAVFRFAKELLHKSLKEYRSFDSDDPHSVLFNVMMSMLDCCGLENGTDFNEAENFNRIWNGTDITYPVTCCKMTPTMDRVDLTCPSTFTDDNSNINRGCWSELLPHLIHYGNGLAIAGIVVLLFQVALITMSVITLAMKQM